MERDHVIGGAFVVLIRICVIFTRVSVRGMLVLQRVCLCTVAIFENVACDHTSYKVGALVASWSPHICS